MPRKISRRQFLGEASCAAVGSASLFSTMVNMQMANAVAVDGLNASDDDYKALVCIFLGGGNDSFNMLVPMNAESHAEYARTRSNLALATDQLLPLTHPAADGRPFGVHPSMPEVQQLYDNGNLAFVANVGTLVEPTTKDGIQSGIAKLPVGLYSHIDQIAHWQTSVPDKRIGFGWGGRTADLLKSLNSNQNISMNISLSGTNTFQSGTTTVDYAIESRGNGSIGIRGLDRPVTTLDMLKKAAIESMLDLNYQNLFEQAFASSTRRAIDSHAQFSSAIAGVAPFTTRFSNNEVSRALNMVAKTIAARRTLGFKRQTFFIMYGGWDHHDELLNNHLLMLTVLSKALGEFNAALNEIGMADNVTTFTASDFARTLTSNGRGTDHAWGGHQMVMGGAVRGGQIYGEYPAVTLNGNLSADENSLIPTTSVDEYCAELSHWFGVGKPDLPTVFPNIERFYDINSTSLPLGFMGAGGLVGAATNINGAAAATSERAPAGGGNGATRPTAPAPAPTSARLPAPSRVGTLLPLVTSAAALGAIALRRRRMQPVETTQSIAIEPNKENS